MKLASGVSALLELTLKTTQDVIKSETALARRSHTSTHATHTDEALGLHSGTTLSSTIRLSAVKAESVTRTWALVAVLVMVGERVARRIVRLLLLLLMTGGGLSVLLCKDTEYTGGDLVMNDSLVVLANDVNAEFLSKN